MKIVSKFQIIDHGVEHSQYFQGCGTSFTEFEDVATGIGSTPKEAFEDALDSLAQNDWDVESIANSEQVKGYEAHEAWEQVPDELTRDYSEVYYHMSVRVK